MGIVRSLKQWVRPRPPANDIGADGLSWGRAHCCSAELLDELVRLSRVRFGWFTKHLPRTVEYPWVMEALGGVRGKKILDIGAGVSPIPLALADAGALVTTVDYSPTSLASIDQIRRGNEWGFLDYALLDRRVTSFNQDVVSMDLGNAQFDAVYSVSVIEHMPAEVRRKMFELIAGYSSPLADVVLTVDLVPGSNVLWNRASGKIVETTEQHGTLESLKEELSRFQFALERETIVRDIPGVEVDCALMQFSRTN